MILRRFWMVLCEEFGESGGSFILGRGMVLSSPLFSSTIGRSQP